MRLLSEAKVASMCESKGEAARRSRGWLGLMPLDLVGEELVGDVAVEEGGVSQRQAFEGRLIDWRLTFVVLFCGLVDDCRVL